MYFMKHLNTFNKESHWKKYRVWKWKSCWSRPERSKKWRI